MTRRAARGRAPERRVPAARAPVALPGLVVLAGLLAAASVALVVGRGAGRPRERSLDASLATCVARAGVADAFARLHAGGAPRALGPVPFGAGSYRFEVSDLGDGVLTIGAVGEVRGARAHLEALVERVPPGPFSRALDVANRARDPRHEVVLRGGPGPDRVLGGVSTGGDLRVEPGAEVRGPVEAAGLVVGAPPAPAPRDAWSALLAEDWERRADFDVAALFAAASYRYDDAGGLAWQVPESSPAHVFRRNPTDRALETAATVKDDYFLEDPYEEVRSRRFRVSLAEGGSDAVYYVDGNLWIHNRSCYSLELAAGTRITLVVRGNVYVADELLLASLEEDGVALLALADEAVADSGNVYFGDPALGRVERMEAFVLAERSFFDLVPDGEGGPQVVLHGALAAGEGLVVPRHDAPAGDPARRTERRTERRTGRTVVLDERLADGRLALPGLRPAEPGRAGRLRITAWRRVAEGPAPSRWAPAAEGRR